MLSFNFGEKNLELDFTDAIFKVLVIVLSTSCFMFLFSKFIHFLKRKQIILWVNENNFKAKTRHS